MEEINIKVAGVNFSLKSREPIGQIDFPEVYKKFFLKNHVKADCEIKVFYDGCPNINFNDKKLLFDSGSSGLWSLYQFLQEYIFVLRSPVLGPQPYQIAIFSLDFKKGAIYNRFRSLPLSKHSGCLTNPLQYPLIEAVMINLLARRKIGIMMHSAGVIYKNKGYLYIGVSGAGKSTLSKLWAAKKAVILNDDRIIIRKSNKGDFWIYGTPWHGTFTLVSPLSCRLDNIFFIKHAVKNRKERLIRQEMSVLLLARSFYPMWSKDAARFSLDFCAEISRKIPGFELGFVPDDSVIKFIS